MKKGFKLVLTAIAIVALTTGCDKNKGSGGGDPIKKMIPSEIKNIRADGNYVYTYKFLYDNKNRITEVKEVFDEEVRYVKIFTYDGIGRLISITSHKSTEHSNDYIISFSYSENYVFISDTEKGDVGKLEVKNGKFIKAYYNYGDVAVHTLTITYDSRGNATKFSYINGMEIFINYENKKGIYSGINIPSWFLLLNFLIDGQLIFQSVNNSSSIKAVYGGWKYITENYYEDYDNDYPIKMKIANKEYSSVKKSKVLPIFDLKEESLMLISDDDYDFYYEIKYIEAK